MTTRLEASHRLLQQFGLIDEFSEWRGWEGGRKSSVQSARTLSNRRTGVGILQRWLQSFEVGGKKSWILLFLNDLPFKNLGTPQNAHLENNVKGKPGFVFAVDFSEVSFDDLMISKKNSLKVSSSICFCWKSWPFLICYKFSFWTGSVKQQWVMAKWLVSPMPHNILGKKV